MGAPKSSVRRKEPSVALRRAQTSDGIAMWRMTRGRASAEGLSPFFYMVLIEHFGQYCSMIDRDGEPIGYIIATAPRDGGVVRVLDLGLKAGYEESEVVFEVLGALVKLPAYRHAEFVEPAPSCDEGLKKALRDLLGTEVAKVKPTRERRSAAAG